MHCRLTQLYWKVLSGILPTVENSRHSPRSKKKPALWADLFFGARGGNRTRMSFGQLILSQPCIPVPAPAHIGVPAKSEALCGVKRKSCWRLQTSYAVTCGSWSTRLSWRRLRESNSFKRFCRPLRNRSVKAPSTC